MYVFDLGADISAQWWLSVGREEVIILDGRLVFRRTCWEKPAARGGARRSGVRLWVLGAWCMVGGVDAAVG